MSDVEYPTTAPADLGERGLGFWNEYAELVTTVIGQVRLEECARILDELDRLGTGEESRVERRQQRTLLKAYLAELEAMLELKRETMTSRRARDAATARWAHEKGR